MIPLFSTEQIRNADKYAIEELNIPGIALMENASLSVFNAILKNYNPDADNAKIGVIAGKGNNGGDAFAVARHFINAGFSVTVIFVGDKKELKGDALINFTVLGRLINKVKNGKLYFYTSRNDLNKIKYSDFIIDGLLGTGAKGVLREPYKTVIDFVNKLNAIKVAIDLPSGLNLETSTATTMFHADLTVTLADLKAGLFYGKGYEYGGKIEKGSIGIGKEYFNNLSVTEYLIEPEDAFYGLPQKHKSLHKYSGGKVLAVVGSGNFIGAASLVVQSLFQVGTGAVLLAFPKSIRNLIAPKIGDAVFSVYNDDGKEYLSFQNVNELKAKIEWADVLALGSGLGRNAETIEAIEVILQKYKSKKMVIDADAIYAVAEVGYAKFNLMNKILTPHHAEFAHLIGTSVTELQTEILAYGKEFVEKTKSVLVLKGAPTIIFTPNGEALINSAGNAGMAKFGTGDVLTGVIAGIISYSKKIEQSVISAVYLHSFAADLLLGKETEYGITATKIKDNLPDAINFIRNSII